MHSFTDRVVSRLSLVGSVLVLGQACHASPLSEKMETEKLGPAVAAPVSVSMVATSPCGGVNDTAIWRRTSKEIIIHEFEYFSGGFRFHADCSLLTKEQLKLLGQLELVSPEHPSSPCPSDYRHRSIEIVDEGGSVRSYQAIASDAKCEGKGERIADDSVSAFAATYSCLAGGARRSYAGAPGKSMNTAIPLLLDDGCEHGFFGGPAWVSVNVDRPGMYVFRGVECAAQEARLTLYSASGKHVLSKGVKEDAPGCWAIEYQTDNPGKLVLRVEGNGGDYFVRLSSHK